MKKRIISFLISVILLISFVPAYAEEIISVFDGVTDSNVSEVSGLKHDGEGIGITAGSGWAKFESVDFGENGISGFLVNVAVDSANAGKTIYFYAGEMNGDPFAELKVKATSGWSDYQWQEATLHNEDIYGVNTVYFTMQGAGVGNFRGFKAVEMKSDESDELPESVINTGMEKIFSVLTALDIIDYNDGDSFNADSTVTAGEFAKSALMLRGESGDEAVNGLLKACDISGTSGITAEKACHMLINLLNRQTTVLDGASYYETASELDIRCGASPDEVITWVDAMRLLYDATDVAPIVINSVYSEDGGLVGSYTAKTDNNLLFQYRKIGKYKGILTMDEFTGLKDVSDVGKGNVLIDDKYIFNVGECDVSGLVGYSVELYFKASDYENTLLYIAKSENNEVTNLTVSDIEDYKNQTLTYYDGEKEKNIRLADDISVIYNGVAVSKYNDSMFNMNSGSIEIISNNRDSIPEVVKIWDTVDYQFAGYSNDTIYFKNSTKTIDLNNSNNRYILKKSSGKIIEPEKITEDSVLTVAEVESIDKSYTFYTIWVSARTANGKVNAVDRDNAVLKLDGKDVKISKAFINAGLGGVFTGAEIKVYLNKYGEIAFVEGNAVSNKLGYVVRCYEDETTDEVFVKIFDEDGEMANYKCYDKIRIDGELANNPYALLQSKNEICVFETNNLGEIRKINFAKDKSSTDANNGLYFYGDVSGMYKSDASSIEGRAILSDAFMVFKIPSDKTDYEKYSVSTSKFTNDDTVTLKCYNRVLDKMTVDIGVQTYNPASATPSLTGDIKLVNKVYEEWTGSDAEVFVEYYAGSDQLITKQVVEWHKDNALALKQGDAIRFNITSDGKIDALQKMFSIQNGTVNAGSSSFNATSRFTYGNVIKKERNIIQLTAGGELFNCAGAIVYVFEDKEIRNGSMQEVLSSEAVGAGSEVWIHLQYAAVKTVVIVK